MDGKGGEIMEKRKKGSGMALYDKEYGDIVGRMEDSLELTCPDCGITHLWKAYGRPDYCKEINCKKCGKVLAHQYGSDWELLSISIGGKMFVPNKDGCFTVELGA